MRKLFVIFTMLAALMLATVTAFAAPSLVDNAKLLNSQQRRTVLAELQKQEQAHGVRMAVVTMQSIGNQATDEFANKLLDTVYNDGAKGNMVLLQVADTRKWYIATDKKLMKVIEGDKAVEYISKPMVAELKINNYNEAYIVYATKAGELLTYYEKNDKPWKPNAGFNWMALAAGLAIGALGAYGYRTALINSMSNVRAEVAANAYLNQGSFALTNSNDSYLYTNVTVTKKPKNQDRDRDGSVSDHGGDRDHGGGGGGY
jgi:uncharacterized protein